MDGRKSFLVLLMSVGSGQVTSYLTYLLGRIGLFCHFSASSRLYFLNVGSVHITQLMAVTDSFGDDDDDDDHDMKS